MRKRSSGYGKKFEKKILSSLEERGVDFVFEGKVIPYYYKARYKPDVVLSNGIMIEIKTYLSYDEQRKLRAVRDTNPELDIRLLFENISKPVQSSKLNHAEWADKHNFKWAEGDIPSAWIEERRNDEN